MHAGTPGRLTVIGGNDRGREFVLAGRETSVGRGVDNHIILTDIAVSRRHITLLYDGTRYSVRDMGSGNGTLVNGVRITQDTFLRDGDQIEIGNTLIRLEHAAQPALAPQQPAYPAQTPIPQMGPPVPSMPGMSPSMPGMPPGMPGMPPLQGLPSQPGTPYGLPLQANPAQEWAQQPQGAPPAPPQPFLYSQHAYAAGSAPVMDLRAAQRKRLLLIIGALLVVGGLAGIVVALATGGDEGSKARSSEAMASDKPALDKLVNDIEKPAATTPSPTTTPAPAPSPAPAPATVASTTPAPEAAPPKPEPAPPKIEPDPKPAPPRETAVKKKDPPREEKKKDPPKVATTKEPAPKSTSAAEKQAAAAYKSKDFEKAAEVLRVAASKDAASADRLTAIARDYAAVGSGISRGDAASAGSPTTAMFAYQEALKADARSGKAAHAPYLRTQIAKVAPRAAMAYMQGGKFEQAKAACDAAANYGVGSDSTVLKVRQMLEGKAKELYTKAVGLEKSNAGEAKALYRRVLKMVPADSAWYTKAYAALNKPSANTGGDEDE